MNFLNPALIALLVSSKHMASRSPQICVPGDDVAAVLAAARKLESYVADEVRIPRTQLNDLLQHAQKVVDTQNKHRAFVQQIWDELESVRIARTVLEEKNKELEKRNAKLKNRVEILQEFISAVQHEGALPDVYHEEE